jgi:lipoprotein-anchoring transpeptidase ErfK/SrfK
VRLPLPEGLQLPQACRPCRLRARRSRSQACLGRPGSATRDDDGTASSPGALTSGVLAWFAFEVTMSAFRSPRAVGSSRIVRSALAAALTALLLVACGGGSGSSRSSGTTSVSPSTSAPTSTTLPPGVSVIAQVSAPLAGVFDDPSSPQPKVTFGPSWHLDDDPSKPSVPEVFLVQEQRPDWVRVLLPTRPNGSSGWIHGGDVQVSQDPYHVQVDVAAHQITVFNATQAIYRGPVADGAPDTPTPTGLYYTRVLLQTPDPQSVYGPFAYGLSAHSDALTTFDGGDAEIGIHGNNDASALGKSVSHGCIRMDNGAITMLTKILPLGTPVQINP